MLPSAGALCGGEALLLGRPLRLLVCLQLVLVLAGAAPYAKYNYFLKRFKGNVDSLCLATSLPVVATMDNADSFIIGTSALVQGQGHSCASIVWAAADPTLTEFQLTFDAPRVIASTAFNLSIWSAKPQDAVSLTVENAVPQRSFTVEPSPVDLDLSAPNSTNPDPPSMSVDPKPAKAFATSYTVELDVLGRFIAWFTRIYYNPTDVQGVIIFYGDPDDSEGLTLKAVYALLSQPSNGQLAVHVFKATFGLGAAAPQLKQQQRRLLQYYGGTDTSAPKGCKYTYTLVNGVWVKSGMVCK